MAEAFEPYEPSVLQLPGHPSGDDGIMSSLAERGFEPLRPGAWSFPEVPEHQIAISDDLDAFAVIDDGADELFAHPLGTIPERWRAHLLRDGVCLVITGISLRLASRGLDGGTEASARDQVFGGMVMVYDDRFD